MNKIGRKIPYILTTPKKFILDSLSLENDVLRVNALVQLTNKHSGAAIIVVDDADDSEHEIFFNKDGFIDDLDLHAVGLNVKLKTIKTQVSWGVDIVQNDKAKMPWLVIAGVVQKQATGILGAAKTVNDQVMDTQNYTMPRNLGVITVYSIDAANWGVIRGGSGSISANGFLALCYGTVFYTKAMSGSGAQMGNWTVGRVNIDKGEVVGIYWDDTAKYWEHDANNGLTTSSAYTGTDRVETSMSTSILKRFASSTVNHKFHAEIQFKDNTPRYEIATALRKMFGVI